MSWLNKHKRIWRVALLLLLLVALLGPWALERVNVPAEFACSPPYIRLEGDFCGDTLSGMWVLSYMVSGLISVPFGFVTGAMQLVDIGREFLSVFLFVMILVLLLSPFFSTLRLMRSGGNQRSRVSHVAFWGLAAVSSVLFMFVSGSSRLRWALWGPWFYIGLAASALTLEALLLIMGRRASQG